MPSCRPTGPAGRVELVVPFGDHVWQSASVVVAAVAWWLIDTFLHQRQQHQAAQEEEKRIRKRQPWQVVGVVVVLRLSRMVSASWNGVVCHLVIQNKKITRPRCGWARGVLIIFSAGPRLRTSLAKVQFVQVRRSTCSSDRRLIWPCAEQEQPGPVPPAWPDVRTLRC